MSLFEIMPSPNATTSCSNFGTCKHSQLTWSSSPYAATSGHHFYTNRQLVTAITGKRKQSPGDVSSFHLDAFPAPLSLPDDEVNSNPKYPPQSFRSWLNLGVRNHFTTRRNVIYVAAPPAIDASVGFMREWCRPKIEPSARSKAPAARHIDIDSVIAYLRAFYHGLEVRLLSTQPSFAPWNHPPRKPGSKSKSRKRDGGLSEIANTALSTGKELVKIGVRTTPPPNSDSPSDLFPYNYQLNLDDLTDAAISILPSDAYALLLTTVHDIYESAEDDFCCGRAWGASRVAIVSSARYDPALDDVHAVGREHVWPASHCAAFVQKMSAHAEVAGVKRRKVMADARDVPPASSCSSLPLNKALDAHLASTISSHALTKSDLSSIHLFRLCRTASHELGHCLSLDHCMYKACVMQGTASVAEDMRQPPYLCPVCEMKVACAVLRGDTRKDVRNTSGSQRRRKSSINRAVGGEEAGSEEMLRVWKRERHMALKDFCEQHGGAFVSLAGWSHGFIEMVDGHDAVF